MTHSKKCAKYKCICFNQILLLIIMENYNGNEAENEK